VPVKAKGFRESNFVVREHPLAVKDGTFGWGVNATAVCRKRNRRRYHRRKLLLSKGFGAPVEEVS